MDLLSTFRQGTAYDRLVMLSEIRDILVKTEPRSLFDFISNIVEPDYLNILLGCGLKGLVWQAVIKRKAVLSGI
jgi:hypothetical protein